MNTQGNQLVVRADRRAVSKDIAVNAILILVVTALLLMTVIPVHEFRSYSKDTGWVTQMSGPPAMAIKAGFALVFIACLVTFMRNIGRAFGTSKDLPVLYTFTQDGLTSHRTNETLVWADFKPFFPLKGMLCLPRAGKGGKLLMLAPAQIDKQVYRQMIDHLIDHAPPALTADVKRPR